MSTARSDPSADLPATAQLILGADKHNPVFTVYRNSEREQLQVYFGFELLESLPDIPESPACKLLLARLCNAGVKIKSLAETFDFDAKTIRRWARSLRCGDTDELIRVLEGRANRRKRTTQVESFVRLRLPELWAERRYGAIQRLRQEIKTIFRIEISAKGLGSLIRELKGKAASPAAEEAAARDESSATGGVLEFGKEEIVVHLMPTSSSAPAMRRIVAEVLEGLNGSQMRFPNGAQRRLRFRLGSRSEIRLHLELASEKP